MSGNGSSKSQRDSVILGAARTAQGKFLGGLSSLSAVEIGKVAFGAAVERSGIHPEDIREVVVGNVVSAGVGQALPRQISIGAGIPSTVGGLSVNKVCGSGMKAVMIAASSIRAEEGDVYLAGGVESMSQAPYINRSVRSGNKYGHIQLVDALQHDGLWCSIENWGMGNAAEFIAKKLEVSRQEMDELSFRSHQLAHKATVEGKFAKEIAPITVKSRKSEIVVDTDESIRPDTSMDALAGLRPAFEADGLVTAGNAPGMNDGAAALVVTSREYAEKNGHQPLARIVSYGHAAVEPSWIFYAPVKAIPIALEKAGWTMDDVDLFEINEAFAAQVMADLHGLKNEGYELPMEKLNVNGGAIALGHPIGASGARLLVTLVHALQERGLKRGLASLCLGGGEAVAMAIELEA